MHHNLIMDGNTNTTYLITYSSNMYLLIVNMSWLKYKLDKNIYYHSIGKFVSKKIFKNNK